MQSCVITSVDTPDEPEMCEDVYSFRRQYRKTFFLLLFPNSKKFSNIAVRCSCLFTSAFSAYRRLLAPFHQEKNSGVNTASLSEHKLTASSK